MPDGYTSTIVPNAPYVTSTVRPPQEFRVFEHPDDGTFSVTLAVGSLHAQMHTDREGVIAMRDALDRALSPDVWR